MKVEEWLNNEELPITIWKNKYRNGDESFEQWLKRVSGGDKKLAELIRDKKFIFAGRILANRGVTDRKITYSNCYVITPPEDNLESIFETGAKLARTFSYGGGCGIDISKLRPKGSYVNNAAKTTSGTTSFMDFYSYVTGLIGQEGRRGATMISISCEHPDLVDCQVGIYVNLNSSETIIAQRLGRILRHPNPLIIIPYFVGTREEELKDKMLENYNPELITTITSLDEIK